MLSRDNETDVPAFRTAGGSRRWFWLATALLPALGLLLLLTRLPAVGHGAATHCVEPSGSGGCFTTIQAAIDGAQPGDQVLVAAGIYTESILINRPLTLQGGWSPAPGLTRTLIHGAGGCTLDMSGPGITLRDLTLRGGDPGVVCGVMVSRVVLDGLDVGGGVNGVTLLVSGPVTQSNLLVGGNGVDGLNYLCIGGAGETLVDRGSRYVDNGQFGVSGGEGCDSIFEDVVVAGSGAAGFYGFGGQCPAAQQGIFETQLLLRRATVQNNGVGIYKACGGYLTVADSWVSDQLTGTLVAGGTQLLSYNSLYVNNQRSGWMLQGDTTAVSRNDTFADNGLFALAGRPDGVNCFLAPRVTVENGIIWSSSTPIGTPAGRPCLDDAPYHVTLSHTLLISAEQYVADPLVVLGGDVLAADPGFSDAAYRVAADSPAVDSGGGTFPAADRDGVPRPQDGDGDGLPRPDRGAYELPGVGYRYLFPLTLRVAGDS